MKFKLAGIACILAAPIILYKIWESGLDKSYIASDFTIFMICMIFVKVVVSFLALFLVWYGYQLIFNPPSSN